MIRQVTMCAALAVGLAPWWATPRVAGSEPAGEDVARWIDQLDADTFAAREAATEHLLGAGRRAVGPLAEAAGGGGLEATTRAIAILRELAVSGDAGTEEAARAALVQLAAPKITAAARRAAAALAALDQLREERAVDQLRRLGARVLRQPLQAGLREFPEGLEVEIDEKWRGGEEGLRWLQWLSSPQSLSLRGPQVGDRWLAAVSRTPRLVKLSLDGAGISDPGLAALAPLQNLEELDIKYTPVSDEALRHLRRLSGAGLIKLYGTKISRDAARRLDEALAGADVDWRRGGFLGVGCQPHPLGCLVAIIHPDSAAARAGLAVGDVILSYDGQATPTFDKLTELISEDAPGETAELEILRGQERLTRQLTLGRWD